MKSIKIDEALRLEPAEGIEIALIGDGAKMTLARIYLRPGTRSILPDHTHPNEQIGTCIEGKGILVSGGVTLEVEPGVSWTIPAGEIHSFKPSGEDRIILYEAWSPPREDYKALAK